MAARLTQLSDVRSAIWANLREAAVATNRHEWRVGVLATTALDHSPDARSVVLREVDDGVIRFYTDARSPKVAQVEAEPRATLVLHSRALSWQLRVRPSNVPVPCVLAHSVLDSLHAERRHVWCRC